MFNFTSILHTGSFSLETVALTMSVSLILGILMALCYRSSHSHNSSFAVMLAVMPVMESSVILLVNGNLGVSLMVLGSFGLIRFRSATGSGWDLGFVFFSMVVGLAVGLGFLTFAAAIAVVVCAVMLLLERLRFGVTLPKEKQLTITIPEDLEYNHVFDEVFEEYVRYANLIGVKTTNLGTMFQLTYLVELKDPAKEKAFIDALRCRNGNLTIILGSVLRNKDDL